MVIRTLLRNAIALAYEYSTATLFYSDIQRAAIHAVHFNGSQHRVLLPREYTFIALAPYILIPYTLTHSYSYAIIYPCAEAGSVEGMVFAEATRTLYWTSTTPPALRSAVLPALLRAAPHARAHLVRTALLLRTGDRPRGLDYDPCERRLYWTNWNSSRPAVQRARIDGRARQTIVSKDILMPNGLALEHEARLLYWADARLDRVECARYDGSHRRVVVRARADHPFAVAAGRGWVAWTDWVARGVFAAARGGGTVRVLRADVPRPCALVLVAPERQLCAADPCAVDNGGCAEMCAVDAHGHATCSCGAGRVLARDGRACSAVGSECPTGQFVCAEGACVPEHLVCDGVPHCSSDLDASDEDLYYCSKCHSPSHLVPLGVLTVHSTVFPSYVDSIARVSGRYVGVWRGRALRVGR